MQKMILLAYDRYQRLLTVHVSAKAEESSLLSENPEVPKKAGKSVDDLLAFFPKTLKSRARALLTIISPRVTWNQRGEAIIGGESIPNSNIVDLVKVQLKDYKDIDLVGLGKFSRILRDINVPLGLLSSSRRDQTGQGKTPEKNRFHLLQVVRSKEQNIQSGEKTKK